MPGTATTTAQVMIASATSTHALLVVVQLVPLGPVKPGYTEPCVILGCQDYTIRVLERSTLIHQVQSTVAPVSVQAHVSCHVQIMPFGACGLSC